MTYFKMNLLPPGGRHPDQGWQCAGEGGPPAGEGSEVQPQEGETT